MNIDIMLESSSKKPIYKTKDSAGADLMIINDIEVKAKVITTLHTGIKMSIPRGFYGQLCLRSSIGSLGLIIPNSPGIIDSDYRGEILIKVFNLNEHSVFISKGERIAQILILPVVQCVFTEVQELCETERGEGGFGSTGKL